MARSWLAGTVSVLEAALFVVLVLPYLGTLAHDYDEAWMMLDARAMARGLRPYVDFPHHEMPLHLYLLAGAGRLFGNTLVGYRVPSLVCVAGTGVLVYRLVRPFAGSLAALVAQTVFLFSSVHALSLLAVPETPMTLCLMLGIVLLFATPGRWATVASGCAFVVGLLIKPTGLAVVAAAVGALLYAREWTRVRDLAVSGVVAAGAGLVWVIVISDGVFLEPLAYHLRHFGGEHIGMWSIDSGFTDMRRLRGIEHPWQLALASFQTFYRWHFEWGPMLLLVAALAAIPIWVMGPLRQVTGLRAFAVLAPACLVALHFGALDFVSARYFIPVPAIAAWLVAGWVWLAERRIPRVPVALAAGVSAIVLATQLETAVRTNRDAWYWGRIAWIAEAAPRVLSFSPIFFVASGTDPGCGFANPALTYGGFGEVFLTSERARRFRVTDERLIACLRADPAMPVVIDWSFYYFTRPGSALRAYLDGEGREQRLFFSPEAMAQWGAPVPRVSFFR